MNQIKRLYTIVLLIAITVKSNAQLVFTSADVNTTIITQTTIKDTSHLIAPGNAGANQTWNFSSILPATTPQTITTTNIPFSSSTNFSAANFVGNNVNGSFTIHSYYNLSSNALSSVGFEFISVNNQTTGYLYPSNIIYPFPLTYNTTNNQTYTQVSNTVFANVPSNQYPDSSKSIYHRTKQINVDSWGTVITPYATHNCLRIKFIETDIDTTFSHSVAGGWTFSSATPAHSDTTYMWITDSLTTAVRMSKVNGTSSTYNYTFLIPQTTVALEENATIVNDVIFPNPAQNTITISNQNKLKSATICDVYGKIVYSCKSNTIDVSMLDSGIYFVVIESSENIETHKFIKQ